jgi:hypothetical protein
MLRGICHLLFRWMKHFQANCTSHVHGCYLIDEYDHIDIISLQERHFDRDDKEKHLFSRKIKKIYIRFHSVNKRIIFTLIIIICSLLLSRYWTVVYILTRLLYLGFTIRRYPVDNHHYFNSVQSNPKWAFLFDHKYIFHLAKNKSQFFSNLNRLHNIKIGLFV